ncbi:CitMHS family citrate-Mg2+:H+ or citrate-Ca2+:H+ symporter [Sphingobium sp. B1D7B]|uniref:CitMHS family transporter n=1 Tax=Sphingobium sp. B1D7B TaxID=2940578 RepID=UPI002224A775|nr:citrate:proton symporter [Sphingobium sp. B1D7B]MCW2406874.1 CitMHS family citrate-Mg2+:H+ or citrate-Ca2+:H+ symporter [Sphingobium sp. B1D7B]
MLALASFSMVAVFMALIMTKRLSAITALILVPTIFAICLGFSANLGAMIVDGVSALAPTGVGLIFAILFFGVMIDAGLFEPLVAATLKLVRDDPVRVLVGTAILALLVSLDGDGATTYMITISALLPLYKRLSLDVRKLAAIVVLANGAMNVVPWAGPTVRVASVLRIDPREIFIPLALPLSGVVAWVICLAWFLGRRERKRLSAGRLEEVIVPSEAADAEAPDQLTVPAWRKMANVALTLAVLGGLVSGLLPTLAVFVLGTAVALVLNFPDVERQRETFARHGNNALSVGGMVFAAGVFTGIMSGTHMIDAMAHSVVTTIPASLGPYLASITALLSIPFTFFVSNDAFYFGVLPVLAEAGGRYGIEPATIGRAALIGQSVHLLSPLVPSAYLLVGLAGIDFATFQRFTLKFALVSSLVFLAIAMVVGVVPISLNH